MCGPKESGFSVWRDVCTHPKNSNMADGLEQRETEKKSSQSQLQRPRQGGAALMGALRVLEGTRRVGGQRQMGGGALSADAVKGISASGEGMALRVREGICCLVPRGGFEMSVVDNLSLSNKHHKPLIPSTFLSPSAPPPHNSATS